MTEQLCDREDIVTALYGEESKSVVRAKLVEFGIAKLVETPMTEGERIANKSISVIGRPDYIHIDGVPHIDITLPLLTIEEAMERTKTHYAYVIDAALAKRTEEAAKIVETAINNGREFQGIAAAIRKLGEAK